MVWCLSLPIKTWLGNCFSSQHPRLQSLTISQTLQQDTERWPAHALCPSSLSITGFLTGVSVKDRRLMEQKELGHRQGRLDMRKEKENRVGTAWKLARWTQHLGKLLAIHPGGRLVGKSGNDVERQLECRRASAKEDNI